MDLYSERNRDKNQPLDYESMGTKLQNQICKLWGILTEQDSRYSVGRPGQQAPWPGIAETVEFVHGLDALPNPAMYHLSPREKTFLYFKSKKIRTI